MQCACQVVRRRSWSIQAAIITLLFFSSQASELPQQHSKVGYFYALFSLCYTQAKCQRSSGVEQRFRKNQRGKRIEMSRFLTFTLSRKGRYFMERTDLVSFLLVMTSKMFRIGKSQSRYYRYQGLISKRLGIFIRFTPPFSYRLNKVQVCCISKICVGPTEVHNSQ